MNFVFNIKRYVVISASAMCVFTFTHNNIYAFTTIAPQDSSFTTIAPQNNSITTIAPQVSGNSSFTTISPSSGGSAGVNTKTYNYISNSSSYSYNPYRIGGSYGSGGYYGGGYYGGYSGFSGYTSAYSYSGGGSTHTPTWKPNTAGWSTDYQLGYSTAENPAVTGDNSWNPDVNSWNTDYALTYSVSHNDNYRVTCIVDDTTVEANDEVEFRAKVTGGSGDYEYEWFGDDGIDEDDDSFEHEFDRNGIYRVTVEVTDADGFTTYDECDAVYVGRDYYTANYVQDYYTGSPQGELASQNSVYLSQIPRTGAADTAKVFGFIAIIAVWSAAIAYYFINQKRKSAISNRIADFKKANLAARA